jgi:cytochrome c oxidase assembly protein subunit 15
MSPNPQNMRAVAIWLWGVALLVALMVIVGGATRLTDSGLSITEWKPLLGAIPPFNEAQWLEVFEKYKQIPEYQIQNRGMSLVDFKFIFWWEWAHRFLGRFIGIAFALPLLFFIYTKQISQSLWPRLLLIFLLGGLQGALGWYMVASGLVDRVDVSQYRLAAHLTVAFVIFAAIVWTAMTLSTQRRRPVDPGTVLALGFLILLFLQIVAGGFVAGLDAGHASYTWPKMNGAYFPDGLSMLSPVWRNAFENALAAQFNHRILAYILLLYALLQAWRVPSGSAFLLAIAVSVQAGLGILTIVLQVPLAIALLHQATAILVLALALWHVATLTRVPAPDRQ